MLELERLKLDSDWKHFGGTDRKEDEGLEVRGGQVEVEVIFEPRFMRRALCDVIHNFEKVSWKDFASPSGVEWSCDVRPVEKNENQIKSFTRNPKN